MLGADHTLARLALAHTDHWRDDLEALVRQRLDGKTHGDLPRWRAALACLPNVPSCAPSLSSNAVGVPDLDVSNDDLITIRNALLDLVPWRKGPFQIGSLRIDSEWQSDRKWQRVMDAIGSLDGRRCLDVGCGNGYYALRMCGMGARSVVGVDPTLVYLAQFEAICHFVESLPIALLPLRLNELPNDNTRFDCVFSMGVLYHQRAPIEHLSQLRARLAAGGILILETLVLPGDTALSRTPEARYARMKNVWHLPTTAELDLWLRRCGLERIGSIDISVTSIEEQRPTEWMPYESLEHALDPQDPTVTVEGWPAPRRALLVAKCL